MDHPQSRTVVAVAAAMYLWLLVNFLFKRTFRCRRVFV